MIAAILFCGFSLIIGISILIILAFSPVIISLAFFNIAILHIIYIVCIFCINAVVLLYSPLVDGIVRDGRSGLFCLLSIDRFLAFLGGGIFGDAVRARVDIYSRFSIGVFI